MQHTSLLLHLVAVRAITGFDTGGLLLRSKRCETSLVLRQEIDKTPPESPSLDGMGVSRHGSAIYDVALLRTMVRGKETIEY